MATRYDKLLFSFLSLVQFAVVLIIIPKFSSIVQVYPLEFVDNGYSDTNFERPAIQELLELVKSYQVNCIIVKDFSRFGRNMIQKGYVRPDRTKVEVEKKE